MAWLVIVLGSVLGCLGGCTDGARSAHPRGLVPADSLFHRALQGYGLYQRRTTSGTWLLASPGTLMVNAEMTVECRDRRQRLIKTWQGPTQWDGEVPSMFGVSVSGAVIERIADIDTSLVRVGVNANGTGGMTLRQWLPEGCVSVRIFIDPLDPSAGEGRGRGGGKQRRQHADGESGGKREESWSAASGSASGSAGRRGGRAGGSSIQKRGNLTRQEGGVESENARASGQAYGDPEGRVGGEGSYGDRGARGAMALFGGLVGVPAAIRSAVEVGLILEEANLLSAGKDFVKHRLKSISGVIQGRELLFQSAQGYAYKATRAVKTELLKNPKFAKLPLARQQQALNVIEWKLQEGYFASVQQAAEAELKHLDELIPELEQAYAKRKSGHLNHQLNIARQNRKNAWELREASQVKPVAGSLPVNHAYAGKELPLDQEIIKALRARDINARSVPFTFNGYPDFTRWTRSEVRIKLTGKYSRDIVLANKKAKLQITPDGYTWHHHQELGRMQLVPSDLHKAARHTGGRAGYKHITGDLTAYR